MYVHVHVNMLTYVCMVIYVHICNTHTAHSDTSYYARGLSIFLTSPSPPCPPCPTLSPPLVS